MHSPAPHNSAELERFSLPLHQLKTSAGVDAASDSLDDLVRHYAPAAPPDFVLSALDIAIRDARDDVQNYCALAHDAVAFARRLRALANRRTRR